MQPPTQTPTSRARLRVWRACACAECDRAAVERPQRACRVQGSQQHLVDGARRLGPAARPGSRAAGPPTELQEAVRSGLMRLQSSKNRSARGASESEPAACASGPERGWMPAAARSAAAHEKRIVLPAAQQRPGRPRRSGARNGPRRLLRKGPGGGRECRPEHRLGTLPLPPRVADSARRASTPPRRTARDPETGMRRRRAEARSVLRRRGVCGILGRGKPRPPRRMHRGGRAARGGPARPVQARQKGQSRLRRNRQPRRVRAGEARERCGHLTRREAPRAAVPLLAAPLPRCKPLRAQGFQVGTMAPLKLRFYMRAAHGLSHQSRAAGESGSPPASPSPIAAGRSRPTEKAAAAAVPRPALGDGLRRASVAAWTAHR